MTSEPDAARKVAAPVAVRDAVMADWPAIARLQIETWRAAYRGILTDAFLDGPVEAERTALWRERFRRDPGADQITVLAEATPMEVTDRALREPLGFCCILAGEDPVWGSLIDNLHVRPGHWGGGLGRVLLRAAALRVPPPHREAALYLTAFEANPRACSAYDAWGGTVVERCLKTGGDGVPRAVLRYRWRDPETLVALLDDAALRGRRMWSDR